MDLIVNDKIITTPVIDILHKLKLACHGEYLDTIEDKGDYVSITCPFHAGGHEHHPSCSVYARNDNPEIVYAVSNCFTCHTATTLPKLVSYILSISIDDANNWLLYNCDYLTTLQEIEIPNILEIIPHGEKSTIGMDEKILDKYNFYHPYIKSRGVSNEIAQRFRVGYNKEKQSITFPVWDDKNNLVMITERSINTKKFFIPYGVDKPVYLLNYIKKNNITSVNICESQINTLVSWSWGYPAVGLFGTGSYKQYELLKKSGIKYFNLCFDGDPAGDNAIKKFTAAFEHFPALIEITKIPRGKDIADLTKEEFDLLEKIKV